MNITLKPSLARFIKQQVKEGRYKSVDHVMTAAVTRLMQDDDLQFAPGELQALVEESEKDIARGDVFTLEEVRKSEAISDFINLKRNDALVLPNSGSRSFDSNSRDSTSPGFRGSLTPGY
jgi:putative addiction module CopG family antidote